MLPIDTWLIIIILAISILAGYVLFYKVTQKKKLHNLTEEHKVSEPHTNLDALQTFIEKCWSSGYSIPEIKEILIEKGWNEETVNKVFYKSKVPNTEENISRLNRNFSASPVKTTVKAAPKTVDNSKPKQAVQPKKKEKSKLLTLEKKKKEEEIPTSVPPGEELDIGQSGPTTEDGYRESDEVTKLKKEVLKDLKK